jgi:hypothetical protein
VEKKNLFTIFLCFLGVFFEKGLSQESLEALALEKNFQRGIVLPLYGTGSTDYTPFLKEIREQEATHISFLIRCYLENNNATTIVSSFNNTPPDYVIEALCKTAHELGLKVMFLPVVFLAHPRSEKEWRGNLEPSNWKDWWDSYTCFLLHYAHLATRCRVEALSVGSELATTEKFTSRWKILIQKVRNVFSGSLTYSANWDHFEKVTFAEELDFLGVSGYYELAKSLDPSRLEILEQWQKHSLALKRWTEQYQKPLIFTEIGYASQNGCASKPWNYSLSKIVDVQEQDLCFEVFCEFWEKSPFLQGIYIYDWWGEGGLEDTGYTPRGKPAAKRIQQWFLKIKNKSP